MPAPALFVSHAERSFDAEGRLHDACVAGELQKVIEALCSCVQLHAANSLTTARLSRGKLLVHPHPVVDPVDLPCLATVC